MLRNPIGPLRVAGRYGRLRTTMVGDAVDTSFVNAKPYEDVPKILSLPIIGSSWSVMPIIGKYDFRKLDEANKKKYKEYGKILREDLSSFNKLLHVFEPAEFEQVFRNEGRFPERRPFESFLRVVENNKDLSSAGLFSTNGDEWWGLRSKVQPHMMKPRTTANYLPAVDSVSQEFIQRMKHLRDEKTLQIINFEDELRRFALESVGLVALDTRLGCLSLTMPLNADAKIVLRSATKIFDMMYNLEFKSPWWRLFRTPLFKEFEDIFDKFTKVAQRYLTQARLRLEKEQKDQGEMTILEQLVANKVDPKDISIMINDLFLGGVDTTYITCGFFLYHISKNPEIQQKLREENKRLQPEKNSPITIEVLNESRYLKACVKESMRMNPAAIGTVRKLTKDTVLAGYRVPAETQIFLHMMVAGHDAKNFPEPTKFRPERWLRDSPESKENNPFAFLPFGFGPRSCVGRRIAEQELFSIIIRILQNFHVEYNLGEMGTFSRLANYPDKPLLFEFHDLN